MGGRAFLNKGIESLRIDKDTYIKLLMQVNTYLLDTGVKFHQIPYYRSKESFGDMDILICKASGFDRKKFENDFLNYELINSDVKPFINGSTTSFLTKDQFQIDFLYTKEKYMDSSLAYYAWNDIGNFFGRIANSYGLKYGHDGLSIHAREGSADYGDIHLSSNPEDIFNFFGWDYDKFKKGFETPQDIFSYVSKQKGFIADRYKFENLDHINRTRNKKRDMYNGLIEWIENNNLFGDDISDDERRIKRKEMQNKALDYFNKRNEWELKWAEIGRLKLIKKKFNGFIVRDLTGLDGIDLGNFMSQLKKREDFSIFILGNDQNVINNWIKNEYQTFSI